MDIDKFLVNGVTVPNPNYRKPTKKDPIGTPKYIQSSDYASAEASDWASGIARAVSNPNIGVNSISNTVNSIDKTDGITFTPFTTLKQVEQQKADKQSWLTQLGNATVQAVANEVVLGSILGFSNLFDDIINIAKEKGEDDYTNALSSTIEQWQDYIRREAAIHRDNPDAPWNVKDTGWWFDNAVSIASTASMLIPSTLITKGVGLLSKATRAGRTVSKGVKSASYSVINGIGKMTKSANLQNKAGRITNTIGNGTAITANAFLSRTMENHLEAREVYKEVYNDALDKVINMDDEQRAKFFDKNPELVGKSNEEIASHIASVSADETFANDYAMLVFDIMQFKALTNLWKGNISKSISGGMREFNKRTAQNVGKGITENAEKITIADRLKYLKENPIRATWDAIKSVEFTEGVEEMYQGIQTEKGKEIAYRIFDPNYNNKTLSDHLNDASIWEQGFWGVIGGIGFKHIGNALGKVYTELEIAHNKKFGKDKWDEKEISLRRMGYDKTQIDEIRNRETLINQFNADMSNLNNPNNFKSNYQTITDAQGRNVLDADGNIQYKELTFEEKEQEKQDTINRFVNQMTINAANAGTYDLLIDYIKDENVQAKLAESKQGQEFTEQLLSKMEDVYDRYQKAIYNIYNSVDVVEDSVAKQVASDIALNQLNRNTNSENLSEIENEILAAAENVNDNDIQAYLAQKRKQLITDYYQGISEVSAAIDARANILRLKRANNEISEQAYQEYLRELDNERQAINNYAKKYFTEFNDVVKNLFNQSEISIELKNFLAQLDTTQQGNANNVPKSITDLLDKQINLEYRDVLHDTKVPKTQQDFKSAYENGLANLNLYTASRYIASAITVRNWLKEQENLDNAAELLANGQIKSLQEELDTLKIGHYSTQAYISSIDDLVRQEQKRRADEEKKKNTVKIDGEEVTETKAEEAKQALNKAEQKANEEEIVEPIPSTGGLTQSEPASPAVSTEPVRNAIVDENGNIIDVPIDEDFEYESITAIEKEALEEIKQQEAEMELSNDALAVSTGSQLLMEWVRDDKNILNVLENGVDTKEFNELVAKLQDKLEVLGVSNTMAKQAALEAMKIFAHTIGDVLNQDYYYTLAGQIATKLKLEKGEKFSTRKLIAVKDLNDIVEAFITAYCKKYNIPIREKGKSTVINVRKLVQDIISDTENISYEEAKYLIRNLRDYMASGKVKSFVFDSRSFVYGLKDASAEQIIAQAKMERTPSTMLSNGMHINLPSNDNARKAAKEKIKSLTGNEIVTFRHAEKEPYRDEKGWHRSSIMVIIDRVEIGYLGKVQVEPNTGKLSLYKQDQGFVYELTPINSNNINEAPICTLDDFFIGLIYEQNNAFKDLMDLLLDYHVELLEKGTNYKRGALHNPKYTAILNNPEIQKLINTDKLFAQGSNKGGEIAKRLHDIIFNEEFTDSDSLYESYKNWKRSIYENYALTLKIQNLAHKHGPNAIKGGVGLIELRNVEYNSNKQANASEANFKGQKLNATNNPIIYFTDERTIVDDKGTSYPNRGFNVGGAGIVLNNNNGNPIIATIQDTAKVVDTPLKADIEAELTNLFTEFMSGNLSFDKLSESLTQFIGGVVNGTGVYGNHLLVGIRVIENDGRIGLYVNDKVKVLIYKNRSKESNQTGTGVTYFNNKLPKGKQTAIVAAPKFINAIVSDIIQDLKFNINYMMPRNINNIDVIDENQYFSKQDGKFVVTINGKEYTYNTYSDFIYDNKIAITNQTTSQSGDISTGLDVTDIQITVSEIDRTSPPVKEETTSKASTTIIYEATETNPGKTNELLESIGISQEEIAVLNGSETNGVPLIIDEFTYEDYTEKEKEAETKAELVNRNGKMVVKPNGIPALTNNKRNAKRLLIHERLHSLFAEKSVFARTNIANELIDTWNAAVEAAKKVKKGNTNYSAAQAILQWNETDFNPTNYAKSIGRELTEEEANLLFAEEWLVESLTQPGIAEFLNDVKYGDAKLSEQDNNTIWGKIVKVLLKLLGIRINNVKDFSILAEHLQILNKTPNSEVNTETQIEESVQTQEEIKEEKFEETKLEEIEDTKVETPTEENPITEDINKEAELTEEDTEDDIDIDDDIAFDDIELLSTRQFVGNSNYMSTPDTYTNNPLYNPSGLIVFINETSFINSFPIQDQENVKKLIEEDALHFECR